MKAVKLLLQTALRLDCLDISCNFTLLVKRLSFVGQDSVKC